MDMAVERHQAKEGARSVISMSLGGECVDVTRLCLSV
jgi:hypothetical protein